MNKMDLISAVAEKADLPKAKAAEVVDAVFGAIEGALKKAEEVRLVGFGSFATATRKASKGRNPQTGVEIDIPESTSVRFKPGKALKDAVNGAKAKKARRGASAPRPRLGHSPKNPFMKIGLLAASGGQARTLIKVRVGPPLAAKKLALMNGSLRLCLRRGPGAEPLAFLLDFAYCTSCYD